MNEVRIFTGQSDEEYDWTRFQDAVIAVLELVGEPTRRPWLDRFREHPGFDLLPVDAERWLTVLHRGAVVMKLHVDVFRTAADEGRARMMVDGEWRELVVRQMPNYSVPDDPSALG